jgi:hypothetical protein
MSHFFGLGPEYKLGIHQEIFSLCYHGQGGFTWGEVYELPIYLRRFYIQQINKVIQEKNKANDDAAKSRTSSPNISKPPTPRR